MNNNPHKYSDEIAHLVRCWLQPVVENPADVPVVNKFIVFELKGHAYPWVILDRNNLCVRQVDGEPLHFSNKQNAETFARHLNFNPTSYEVVEINGSLFTFTKEVEYTDDYSI